MTTKPPLLGVALLVLVCGLDTPVIAQQQKEVLVLYATRRDAQIAIVGDREMPRVIEQGLGDGLDYYSEFIDQVRVSEPKYQDAFAQFLKAKYHGVQLDVIIAMGDQALQFAASRRDQLFGSVPIVYFSDRMTDRPPNATGIIAEANFGDTLVLARELQPDARDVYVITGTAPNNQRLLNLAMPQFHTFEPALNFHYLTGLPTAELERRLASLPRDAIVYYLIVDRDGAGVNFHPLDYIDRIVPVSTAPVYSWVDSLVGRGIVGGSLKNQQAETEAVATLALRVLNGEAPDRIPVATPNLNAHYVDWRQLQRWGLRESRVPATATLLYREPSDWERYGKYVVTALVVVVAQSVLIFMLLVQRRRRLRAEAQLTTQQDELQDSYDRIRNLGARLLDAQERERARIARELHDDISQRMAVLGMDLKVLGRSLHGSAAALTHGVVERTQEITRSIHDLAHQLHPARLRLLGLVGALQGLEREMSRPGLTITIAHGEIPPLSPDLTLCLFRIVQEALQNAIKYSQARRVQVSVNHLDGQVNVTVSDDGVGFNLDSTRHQGLGLISMRERIEAVGGTLSIFSQPGRGTRLIAAVPVAVAA